MSSILWNLLRRNVMKLSLRGEYSDCMREELFIETRKLKLCCLKIIKTDNAGLFLFYVCLEEE